MIDYIRHPADWSVCKWLMSWWWLLSLWLHSHRLASKRTEATIVHAPQMICSFHATVPPLASPDHKFPGSGCMFESSVIANLPFQTLFHCSLYESGAFYLLYIFFSLARFYFLSRLHSACSNQMFFGNKERDKTKLYLSYAEIPDYP